MFTNFKQLLAVNPRNEASDAAEICNYEDNYYGDKVCVPVSSESTQSN